MPKARRRIITSITLTWHYEGDPDTLHTDTLEHADSGQDIDGLIWSKELVEKIHYNDASGPCRKAGQRPGKGGWHVKGNPGGGRKKATESATKTGSTTEAGSTTEMTALSATAGAAVDGDCYWIHINDCIWEEYCPNEIS